VAYQGTSSATVIEHQDDHGCHVALRGRLDVRTVADLRLTLHRLITAGSSALLLDLGEVHVGDATGFGLIVECLRLARRAGRPVCIVAADARTERLLRRARLGPLLSPAPECPAALEAALAAAAG
jgi:anti-anti-sigma factor